MKPPLHEAVRAPVLSCLPRQGKPLRKVYFLNLHPNHVARSQSRAFRAQRKWTKDNSTTRLPRKHPNLNTEVFVSDSSAEEDVKDASAAPEPDAEIMYSYDAPHGPAQGGQVLSMALAKAVEKFETTATEKLVKDEYEVVGYDKELNYDGYSADEDDFELV